MKTSTWTWILVGTDCFKRLRDEIVLRIIRSAEIESYLLDCSFSQPSVFSVHILLCIFCVSSRRTKVFDFWLKGFEGFDFSCSIHRRGYCLDILVKSLLSWGRPVEEMRPGRFSRPKRILTFRTTFASRNPHIRDAALWSSIQPFCQLLPGCSLDVYGTVVWYW